MRKYKKRREKVCPEHFRQKIGVEAHEGAHDEAHVAIPDKRQSGNQKLRITEAGKKWLAENKSGNI